MNTLTNEIITMLDMLPEEEQKFACELLKRLVLAWDPDFTKLTPEEAKELEIARQQIKDGEYYDNDEIDWENLDNLDLD